MSELGTDHNRDDIDVKRLCGKCSHVSSMKRERGVGQTCSTCGKDPGPYKVFTATAAELNELLAQTRGEFK